MKEFLFKLKSLSLTLLAIIVIIIVMIPVIIYLYKFLVKGRTIQFFPKFSIIEIDNKDGGDINQEVLGESIRIGKEILYKIRGI